MMQGDGQSGDRPVILVVDDEKNTRDGLRRALGGEYNIRLAENADSALRELADGKVDIMLSDVRMPGMDGLTLLRRARAQYPDLISILLTAYGNIETAVEAMKQGAYDFLTKPINLDHLDLLVRRALRSREVESENMRLQRQLDKRYGMENIIGNSVAMEEVFDIIRQAAPTQASVLILGPSGTGKELVAHALHRLSSRSRGPFVAVHCAALSTSLLESELFGHEKGAFTGATARRKGRFEAADGGTLFLDEVSEIEPSIQVKLLRVLEERCFERVGGDETVEVDIRLIAASNRDLRAMVAAGEFREDLFFRLDVVSINLPPLSRREADIPLLCNHFLNEYRQKNGKNIKGLSPEAMDLLCAYDWPGNVRELRNTIEKMVVLARGERLTPRDVPAAIQESIRGGAPESRLSATAALPSGSLAEVERAKVLAALRKHNGNRTRAATELGISRRTLHRKIREYKERFPEAEQI